MPPRLPTPAMITLVGFCSHAYAQGRCTELTRLRSEAAAGTKRALWLFVCMTLALVLNSGSGRAQQEFDRESYYRAVEYCRGDVSKPMALSADQKILCFDGSIVAGINTTMVAGLDENGLFVVRSPGGDATTAIAISDLLRSRRATTIVYDYCLSACANFFFVAAFQTYVLKGSLVAWHNRRSGFPDCTVAEMPRDGGPKNIRRAPCDDTPPEYQAGQKKFLSLQRRFYSERTIDQKFEYPPYSIHVRKVLKNMYEGTGVYQDVAWTWNPRFLKNAFKTKIAYEAYPQSQEEVDGMAARFGFGKVIYDP